MGKKQRRIDSSNPTKRFEQKKDDLTRDSSGGNGGEHKESTFWGCQEVKSNDLLKDSLLEMMVKIELFQRLILIFWIIKLEEELCN